MKRVSANNFGLLIAYLVPGFTALWGASFLSPTLRAWLTGPAASGPTVGGFLYVTLASVAAGVTISAVRWAIVDTLHHRTGVRPPQWDFSKLQSNIDAYTVLIEIFYNYYKFYSNTLVALVFSYASWRVSGGFSDPPFGKLDVACIVLAVILFAGCRNTIANYYRRVEELLGT